MAKGKTKTAEPPLRSDARRNRDDILTAAVRAFAKDASASLDGIAKAAGVGIGTLYRHYPTREALMEAAYRSEIEKLCDAAPELLEKHAPDVALARFLDRFIDHAQTKTGMVQAMRAMVAAGNRAQLNQSLTLIGAAVEPMLEAGKARGLLRDDVTVDDFIMIKGAVATARPETVRRLATILLAGLRPSAAPSKAAAVPQRAAPRRARSQPRR